MPIGPQIEDEELEEELGELQQEAMDDKMLKTGTVPVGDEVHRLPAAAHGESKFHPTFSLFSHPVLLSFLPNPQLRKVKNRTNPIRSKQSKARLRKERKKTKKPSWQNCKPRWQLSESRPCSPETPVEARNARQGQARRVESSREIG
jgi:hypothetical protein